MINFTFLHVDLKIKEEKINTMIYPMYLAAVHIKSKKNSNEK